MKITKRLKFVEGEGFEKMLQYHKNIVARMGDVEGTEKLFNKAKEQILNGEYSEAKESFERISFEEIPSDAVLKMAQLGEEELNNCMKTWCEKFLRTREGFHMLIYQYI